MSKDRGESPLIQIGTTFPRRADENQLPSNAHRLLRVVIENAKTAKKRAYPACELCGAIGNEEEIIHWFHSRKKIIVYTTKRSYHVGFDGLCEQMHRFNDAVVVNTSGCDKCITGTTGIRQTVKIEKSTRKCCRCGISHKEINNEYCDVCEKSVGATITLPWELESSHTESYCPVCCLEPDSCVCNYLSYNAVADWF